MLHVARQVRCRLCQAQFGADETEYRRTLIGRWGHIDDWSPDEYVEVCPACGASETIENIPDNQEGAIDD